ncbi:MAG: recombination mediator RecR [Opitutales bacterium]
MTPAFEKLLDALKRLPGLGFRSAERIALRLLVEKPELAKQLRKALTEAEGAVRACVDCGNLSEEDLCALCSDPSRDRSTICVVEHVPDLFSLERAGVYRGLYHALGGKLSPIHGIGHEDLNIDSLKARIERGGTDELILALPNDVEGEATCHYLQEEVVGERQITVSRIGFGIPSGAGVTYSDSTTLRSALDGRRSYG